MVGGKGLDRIAPVRDDHEHPLHPLGVLLECLHVREWFRLGREARVGLTVGTAHGPAFARLAGVEEGSCGLGDGLGGGRHDLTPSPSCRLKTPGCGARRLGRCTRSPRSVSRLYAPNSHLQRFAAPIEHGTARPAGYDSEWPDEAPAGVTARTAVVADGFYQDCAVLAAAGRWLLSGPTWQERR